MRVVDERVGINGTLDDTDPVIRELLEKLSGNKNDEFEVILRNNRSFSVYTNGAYLYMNRRPDNEAELTKFVNERCWCHLFVIPDEDNPGHCYMFVLDPQKFCPHQLQALFYPQL